MFRAIIFSVLFCFAAVLAVPQNIISDITSGVGDATSVLASVGSDVTSVGAGVFETVTSEAGNAVTLLTSVGGSVLTLATDGFGSVTSIAGSEFTIATSDAGSAFSGATSGAGSAATSLAQSSSAANILQPWTIFAPLFSSFAAVLGGVGVGLSFSLKLQRDKLKQYQKKIQTVLDREHEIARQHLRAGNKQRAVVALRKRKYQESQLAKSDSQLESLEQLVATIEFSLVQASVLHGLKQGNDVLKAIHKDMNPESVERLLDETAEAQAYQREMDEMLANTLSVDEEEAVQTELRELEAETDTVSSRPIELPSAPKEPVAEEPREEIPAIQDLERPARVALEA
ncbi:hypothetical protein EW145_g5731 [Phellinidium pouzarii]|uniref:BZIP domain-containing protein n=1 Tax=Phellinidium pouzarii TaxID=167371 RepID=A0A4S4L0V7_9AGAM|nr:hypothetical protein EW145_g5731 [Phellinidium pouzarii]